MPVNLPKYTGTGHAETRKPYTSSLSLQHAYLEAYELQGPSAFKLPAADISNACFAAKEERIACSCSSTARRSYVSVAT